jgi:hypothetical protein
MSFVMFDDDNDGSRSRDSESRKMKLPPKTQRPKDVMRFPRGRPRARSSMARAMVMAITYNSNCLLLQEVAKASTQPVIIIPELYLEYTIRYGSSQHYTQGYRRHVSRPDPPNVFKVHKSQGTDSSLLSCWNRGNCDCRSVSSTFDKSSNKKNLLDGNEETCWSSQQVRTHTVPGRATFDLRSTLG